MFKYVLFDLDNTLYSARHGLEDSVGRRIAGFVSNYLNLPPEEAMRERGQRITRYSTTLEWLMAEKGFTDIEGYYRTIHPEGEADLLPLDPALRPLLQSIPAPCAILTNSPKEHADRVLRRLGVEDLFTRVFDIRWNRFKGKPAAEVFLRVLAALGAEPETALFIDDLPRFVDGYRALGGAGVLLDEHGAYPDYPQGCRIHALAEIAGFFTGKSPQAGR
ncbi:MAG: HAD-IA family hydrolase [Spirochaetaceae bacterium]|jgi:putative hydrolase of the HAD superfamily|nr:HAD-IA family hydrolase [Spirochaetaceae bacterium]